MNQNTRLIRKLEDIETIKKKFGTNSIKEIAASMDCSPSRVLELIKFAKEKGLWFTEEEEREIRLRKKNRINYTD